MRTSHDIVGTVGEAMRSPSWRFAPWRLPQGSLLVLTLPAFAAYVAVALATVATKVETTSGELTAEDVSALGWSWIVLHVLWIAPSVLAGVGLVHVADRARFRSRAAVGVLALVTGTTAVLYLLVQLNAYGLEVGAWGDNGWYAAGVALSLALGWCGTIPATLLVTRDMRTARVLPRTATVVGVLLVLYLVWEVLTYAVVVLGGATLAGTVGPPPLLLGVLWSVLGVGLWLSRGGSDDRSGR